MLRCSFVALLVGAGLLTRVEAVQPAVAVILEDNGADLLKLLTNPTGDPGEGHVENAIVFSGKSCVKIIPMQRFSPRIPGWKYRIVEKPKPGEYRYLRFAWKSDGGAGIMLQLHDEKDWRIRYTAGIDQFGWGTKFIGDKPPPDWTVVTIDLFKDHGERSLTGIAMTAFGGTAAYFDHIYFARTIDDLDRIDATGLRKLDKPVELSAADLNRLWQELTSNSAPRAYVAFWSLVADPKHATPFLKGKLIGATGGPTADQIRRWIAELDHERFATREAASRELTKHLDVAAGFLEKELEKSPSAEVRRRVERLLSLRKENPEPLRQEKAVRILEYVETAEATRVLEELAKARDGSRLSAEAKTALVRLKARKN